MDNSSVKVLIIEDDAYVSLLLKEFLTKWGYSIVDTVTDGEEAIASFEKYQPDLLLVDLLLEGSMTGIDVVSSVKKTKDIPVLYITPDLDSDIIENSKFTEPCGYLLKPFEENHLKATIENALSSFSKINNKLGKLKDELSMAMMQVDELTETNAHLITATFRERALKKELEVYIYI